MVARRWVVAALLLAAIPAQGQETGAIRGRVMLEDGSVLPGVSVTASGDVLPTNRITVTATDGDYRFALLPPGNYLLTFEREALATQVRSIKVLLEQTSVVDITLTPATLVDLIEVTAAEEGIDLQSTAISDTVADDVIAALPVGQEYRDLVKLAPGVMYTSNIIRGPSVGGNGQDNVYKLDGVDVTLPLFGTLATDPTSYDVEQVSFLRGGSKAVDFNRSGGLTVNSVTRSGTNRWRGFLGLQVQTEEMTGARVNEDVAQAEEDRNWLTLGFGGPLLRDQLFFYGSYYRPDNKRQNKSNVYGEVPDARWVRDEAFAKLTWTPTDKLLFGGSYRSSETDGSGTSVCNYCAGTTSQGTEDSMRIAFLEGSWLINSRSSLNLKYSDFENRGIELPDNGLSLDVGPGRDLDVAHLEGQGYFEVPVLRDGNPEFNAFAVPVIERYGFLEDGVPRGGGRVGVALDTWDQVFLREQVALGYDYFLGDHQLHLGYQWYEVAEALSSVSNGWGWIQAPGGLAQTTDGRPIYYTARFLIQSLAEVPPSVVSSFESQGIELNDTFSLKQWTFNLGVLFSNDKYFGSGLRETGEGVSGYELASGTTYEMIDVGFSDMIQPRLGATWSWNGREKAFASFARYHPAASSLPRAASWDRNLALQTVKFHFDIDGTFLEQDPVPGSSGKWFQDGLEPRHIDEYLLGYDRQLSGRWIARGHFRYRHAANFWEDTNNDARVRYDPPSGIPRELYVPNLDEIRSEIGGSSYVIAQLDDAFTDYYEVALETEYRSARTVLHGSYVWSQYYGNFDQDGTNSWSDNNVFIGSSWIGDGAGRQIWNYRYGYLRGDRRHQLKLYGVFNLPWDASTGAWLVYQDGHPWEVWDAEVYRAYTGSVNEASRYAEPAGNRRTDDHYELDVSYTQNFPVGSRYNIKLRADLFNVFDRQTGHDIVQERHSAGFGEPLRYFPPRRLQLSVVLEL